MTFEPLRSSNQRTVGIGPGSHLFVVGQAWNSNNQPLGFFPVFQAKTRKRAVLRNRNVGPRKGDGVLGWAGSQAGLCRNKGLYREGVAGPDLTTLLPAAT